MARTSFSGPVASDNGFIFPDVSAAVLVVAADPINTTGKVAGKAVVDLASGLIYIASGPAPTDDWLGSDGTTTVTPA